MSSRKAKEILPENIIYDHLLCLYFADNQMTIQANSERGECSLLYNDLSYRTLCKTNGRPSYSLRVPIKSTIPLYIVLGGK